MTSRRTLVGLALSLVLGIGAGMVWPQRSPTTSEPSRLAGTEASPDGRIGPPASRGPRVSVERRALVTTPGAPGYDPVRLIQFSGSDSDELFEFEPRDEAFAVARERDLSAAINDALEALSLTESVHEAKVECHTAMCRVTLTTNKEMLEEMSANLGIFPLADLMSPGRRVDPSDSARGFVSFMLSYQPERLDADAFRAWYEDLLTKMGLTRELGMAGVPPAGWWKEGAE